MIDYQTSNIINAAMNINLRSAAGIEKFRKIVHSIDLARKQNKLLMIYELQWIEWK
jgi:hypothetical protein